MSSFEEIIAPYSKDKVPGCAIGVIRNGKVISEVVLGYENLENDTSVSQETDFRLASVTKQFIAVAILLLAEKKQISMEDVLFTFFPDFPDYGKNITIHHLLTHSSGLLDYENLIPENQGTQIHDEEVFELLKSQKDVLFTPGSLYSYNNGGYCLLRLIIEKVSKEPIDLFLKENLFIPLGMNSTIVNYEGVTSISNRAYGYSYKDSQWIKTDQDQTSATVGDGGIYSSIKDMQKWSQVFYVSNVLSKESRELMLTRHILTDKEKGLYYGYGLCLKDCNGKKVAYHGGSSIGFETGTYYILDEEIAVTFLSNRTGDNGSLVVERIADTLQTFKY